MKGSTRTKLDELAYKRDGFACVECGRTKGIEAHHKIPALEKLDNLITLCHRCHKKKHGMSGCFKEGYDERRAKLFTINRTHFFNRYSGSWQEKPNPCRRP